MKISTKLIHATGEKFDSTGAISTPIYLSSTYAHERLGEGSGFDYSRLENPTRMALESLMTELEGGVKSFAFASGMAAISCLFETLKSGAHVITSHDIYGGTRRFFDTILARRNIAVSYVDTRNLVAVKSALQNNTKIIFIETPSNPCMFVSDVTKIAEILKGMGAKLMVDNTFLTPYFMRPIELGADVVMHSATKYLGGHNDCMGGILTLKNADFAEEIGEIFKTVGSCLSAFDSWLILRGMKTLSIRMEKISANALKIAEWLKSHKNVTKVHYVGLPEHKQHEISARQTSGFGGMISFEVDDKKLVPQILGRVKVIYFAESLGGVESLITYPLVQTHAAVPPEDLAILGINEKLLRLSVGIEDVGDLIADLKQAIEG